MMGTPSAGGGGGGASAPPSAGIAHNAGRFNSDFELTATLGEGTFGTVMAARGKVDGIDYAIKRSKQRLLHCDRHDRDNMMAEIHACSKLSAASEDDEVFSIVRYFGAWIEDEHVYLQMELCEISLEGMMGSGTRFEGGEIFTVLRHVLLALKFLHAHNFVHLDIKPANILFKQGHYKLGDFGLARRFLEEGHVTSGVEEGDTRYLAPELLDWNVSEKDLTKADLFSAGITVYELITGIQLPSNGELWHRLRSNNYDLAPAACGVTQELVDVTRALMHADPAQRPSAQVCLGTFLGLASDKDREIHRLLAQNEQLQRLLAAGAGGGAEQDRHSRLKRNHSIM